MHNLEWGAEDVLTHEPLNADGSGMTLEQAEAWMDRNWKYIRDRLCELGNGVIGDLLELDGYDRQSPYP